MDEILVNDPDLWFHNHWLLSKHEEIYVKIDELGNLVFRAMIADSFTRNDVYPMQAVLG